MIFTRKNQNCNRKTVMVTGGTGFIGAHASVELIENGYDVIIVDSLINSKKNVIHRIEKITGQQPEFCKIDITDSHAVDRIFSEHHIHAVMHFAAFKAISESVKNPMAYYRNNVVGLLTVLKAMQKHDVKKLVFSSSATVYGNPKHVPINENFPLLATNPYGQTKLFSERILTDLKLAEPDWRIAIMRYFNPIGAHPSGLIGEDPKGIPNNLVPYIAQVAIGKRKYVQIFGINYPTPDGTGIRDYIHIVDLARGHIAALAQLEKKRDSFTVNLGTGQGYSVLEVIKEFEKVSGHSIPFEIAPRRPGDVAVCYADPSSAYAILGWRASYDLKRMCADQWHWQSKNQVDLTES